MERITDKPCEEMSNQELSDFILQGAWRFDATSPDVTAYKEAAKRLVEVQ